MAGDHNVVKFDPAVERWNLMRENVFYHFRFTPGITRKVLVLGFAIPAVVGYMSYKEDLKWDWLGRKKGESLRSASSTPSPTASEEAT